jgi:RNA polymerase sigma factor (sigma-70 family)
VSDADREQRLARRAIEAGVLVQRAEHWDKRYRGFVKADDLESRANEGLLRIVREFKDEIGAFDDYCRRRIDLVMLTGIRVEARRMRIDWAAQLASADLLSAYRSDPTAPPKEQMRDLARAIAAGTFVVTTQEAQRGGDEDMIAREDYATALSVMASMLSALPKPKRRLFVLHYQDGKPLAEIRKVLGMHQNTVERWRVEVLDEIRKELAKKQILHAPGRGGAPRVAVLSLLREPEDAVSADDEEGSDEDEEGDEEEPDR